VLGMGLKIRGQLLTVPLAGSMSPGSGESLNLGGVTAGNHESGKRTDGDDR